MLTKDHHLLPVMGCLFAATLWGVMWYPLRLLEAWGLSGLWAALIIYLSALVPVLPGFWKKRHLAAGQPLLLSMIALAAGWANLGFILAVLEGNVVRVLLLFYLSPVWAVLLGRLFLNEHLTERAWASLLLALTGAVIMLWRPGMYSELPGTADMMAVSSGFAFAVLNVLLRKCQSQPLVVKMTSSCIGVALLSALCAVLLHTAAPVWNAPGLLLAVLIGVPGILSMTFAAQYGVTHLPVHRSAELFLFEIVAGAVSAALLTEEIVTAGEWTGGVLVVMAAWITATDTLRDQNPGVLLSGRHKG